jgi:hypothetical protein
MESYAGGEEVIPCELTHLPADAGHVLPQPVGGKGELIMSENPCKLMFQNYFIYFYNNLCRDTCSFK